MAKSSIRVIDYPYTDNTAPLFAKLRVMPGAVWLDSGKPGSLYGRFDIISSAPDATLETYGNKTLLSFSSSSGEPRQMPDPFSAASELVAPLQTDDPSLKAYPFTGGLIGYWGYHLQWPGSHCQKTHNEPGLPDMRVGRYLWALVINHSSRKANLFAHPECPESLLEEIEERLSGPEPCYSPFVLKEAFKSSTAKDDYLSAIAKIKDYIGAGDCYQVNLAQHFQASYKGDTWNAYSHLRERLPSPFSAYIAWDDKAIMSFSPERFVKLSMGEVETRPIKGTLPRGKTVEQDQQLALQLQNSLKDRAENLMIVDLLRNDLGKSCLPGTIKVPKLFELESFKNVHHLVSTVTATLDKRFQAMDLLKGCFPGGSITGAPKKRAMEIIDELEPISRGIYCGSIGYLSATGRMDTNIAIRTLVAEKDKLHCWGGGGITGDSNPESEYQESLEKVEILMAALQQKTELAPRPN